ncbi:hypothetical protein B6N60_01586 [Richelia sinica FACHB-800]|uniref:Uncharacterized protein n=1 Tax=Richelia sinica FACHB-800 TaxID=1357546 RepID=A0A975T6F1_9NOST|nr:hypothetical protein B6N60_01586 [Richelia sinica FACHB-800]
MIVFILSNLWVGKHQGMKVCGNNFLILQVEMVLII